jgi:hypothetical protein
VTTAARRFEQMTTLDHSISKLEIVEFHLLTAIQMISLEQSEISTHVIVMACEEMILSLATVSNIFLDHDYRIYVKDEHHKEYRKLVRKPYNFFKHADDDPSARYDGPNLDELRTLNEVLTLMNIIGYRKISGKNLEGVAGGFCTAMLLKRPKLFRQEWIDSNLELRALLDEDWTWTQSSDLYLALREHLFHRGHLPQIPHGPSAVQRTKVIL